MKTVNVVTGAMVFLSLGLGACSQPKPHLGESITSAQGPGISVTDRSSRSILPSGGLAGEESRTTEVEAKVDAVDIKKRLITLSVAGGKPAVYKVASEVRNLPQVKPGDLVKVHYGQIVSFEVREPTAEELKIGSASLGGVARAKEGTLPGAALVNAGIAVVTIASIDKKNQQLTVQTQDGKTTIVNARYPENLALVKEGQKAVITYAESVVAGVERVQ